MQKLPIGIQSFRKLREEGCLYVDKTEVIYRLVNDATVYFLSRPRRFGKSLLCSTLQAYFEGRKELFEGLAIEKLETQWQAYPVLYIDFNGQLYGSGLGLRATLHDHLSRWESKYGLQTPADFEDEYYFNITGEKISKVEFDLSACEVIYDTTNELRLKGTIAWKKTDIPFNISFVDPKARTKEWLVYQNI